MNKRAERMMSRTAIQFPTPVFSVDVEGLAPHRNPVPCVLAGRKGPVSVIGRGERVTGDVLLIRPGIEHRVVCSGGINAMYLDD